MSEEDRSGRKMATNHHGLGNWTYLKPIDSNDTYPQFSRIMKISEMTYRRFVEFSKAHYNVETYDQILLDLIDSYEKHNPKYIHYLLNQ